MKSFLTKLTYSRYLATGDQMLSIALAYRVGESTAHAVVKETCAAIVTALSPLYLRTPNKDEWKEICAGYLQHWNFPNCVGAIDGKHVQIQAPPNSGSLYYNYKKTFSIVLLAACDYYYKFTLVDVGAYGSESDSGVFNKSNLSAAFRDNTLNLPKGTAKLPGSELQTPCFFVADDAFALTEHMMKPYSKRHLSNKELNFNYRLSRARRTIENAFGILTARWRIFRRPIAINPCYADNIVVSALCLHNFLKIVNDEQPASKRMYCPSNFVDCEDVNGNLTPGAWRSVEKTQMQAIRKSPPCRAAQKAFQQRDALAQYFLTPEGEVPWQYEYIQRGRYAA